MPLPVYVADADVYVVDVWSALMPGMIASYVLPLPGGGAAVVDPGPASSADFLAGSLEQLGLRLEAVIVTHVHLDHAGAAGHLAEENPGVKVYVHPRGAPHLADPTRLWESSRQVLGDMADVYGKPKPVPRESLVETSDGGEIPLPGGRRLVVLHTPGHASHHQSIYDPQRGVLFTGDSAGVILETAAGTARAPTTPPRLKPKLYLESLERMRRLEPGMVAPTHFGVWPEGARELEVQVEVFRRWMDALAEIHARGVRDPVQASRLLAARDGEASKLYKAGGYIRAFFLYETVWGMLDAIERGEWP
ncbi:MAG: MBL fold metallo-hydrolase [Desulfurococcales archaeon]|nr:MBL fold metallo-hydrolase [Desulfurococcales archaeon]